MNRDSVVEILLAHRQQLQSLGVRSLTLFGSIARNEGHANSDVDLLAEFIRPFGLFQFCRVQEYLQELLGCSVDLGTREMLKVPLKEVIQRDAYHVF